MTNLNIGNWKAIQILKAGTHTTMGGQELTFTHRDIELMAAAYNAHSKAGNIAPLCVGHPGDDKPVYGSTAALISRQGKLFSLINPDNDLVNMVRAGHYKKVSAAFHPPGHRKNPAGSGAYYLRHIGFLGAQPPAIKGMESIDFAEGDAYPLIFHNNQEGFYFSECNNAIEGGNAARHKVITEVAATCGIEYSEALSLTKPFIWSN